MPKLKKHSYFPTTQAPKFCGLSQRDEHGELLLDLARDIQTAVVSHPFKIATELPAFRTNEICLPEASINALLDGLERVLESRAVSLQKRSAIELAETVSQLQAAAIDFETAIKAYIDDRPGLLNRHKLARLIRASGLTEQEVRRLRYGLKSLATAKREMLTGASVSTKPTQYRDNFGWVLLDIYVGLGGQVSKTKSQDKASRNHAASFLLDISNCLRSIEEIPEDILFLKDAAAERFAVSYAKRTAAKGT